MSKTDTRSIMGWSRDGQPLGFNDLLPLPSMDTKHMSEQSVADYRRIKAMGHVVYVRKLGDAEYEMIDGGPAKCD